MLFKLVKVEENIADLELLEQIYKKVRIDELVKFNGKAYKRCRPIKNKYRKVPYHFCCVVDDIYKGNMMIFDGEEYVNSVCHHKAVVVTEEDRVNTISKIVQD